MLSSVSYVCLGVCAGMWVISMGMYLSVLVLSFISVLLFQRSGYFIWIWLFRVCGCSSCSYFADVRPQCGHNVEARHIKAVTGHKSDQSINLHFYGVIVDSHSTLWSDKTVTAVALTKWFVRWGSIPVFLLIFFIYFINYQPHRNLELIIF